METLVHVLGIGGVGQSINCMQTVCDNALIWLPKGLSDLGTLHFEHALYV